MQLSTDFDAGRNAFWMDGGIHAREWISPATMVYFIDQVLSISKLILFIEFLGRAAESREA